MKPYAIVAAAGCSSRMGSFKPLLPLGGRPAIVRLLSSLLSGGAAHCIVVTGYRRHELEAVCGSNPNLSFVHNPRYAETEMFDSARLAFPLLPEDCDRVLFTPADIPLVSPDTVRAVLSVSAPLVYPSCGNRRGHPFAFSASLLPALRIDSGEGGFRGAFARLGVSPAYAVVEDAFIRADMDTPDEYHALCRGLSAMREEETR